jgi:hypothetical protein
VRRPLGRPRRRWEINIRMDLRKIKSRDSSVGITLGYGRVQNGSGAHQASYTMGTRDSFPGGKAARA